MAQSAPRLRDDQSGYQIYSEVFSEVVSGVGACRCLRWGERYDLTAVG